MQATNMRLAEDIDMSQWIQHPSRYTLYDRVDSFTLDNVGYKILSNKNSTNKSGKTRVMMRIGNNILDKLDWKKKDGIMVYNDKNDPLNLMLVKSTNGYSLGKDGSNKGLILTITWGIDDIKLSDSKFKKISYVIAKDKLYFRLA